MEDNQRVYGTFPRDSTEDPGIFEEPMVRREEVENN